MIAQAHFINRLAIECGPADRNGVCKLIAKFDGQELHVDRIPPDENFRREKFSRVVRQKIGDLLCGNSRVPSREYLEAFSLNGGAAAASAADMDFVLIGDKVREAAKLAADNSTDWVIPRIVMASEVEPREREWLWPDKIVMGGINLLAGMPDMGKSLIWTDIASRVSNGSQWPDCDECAPLGGVVVLSDEDDPETTIRPRLDASGADCSRIALLRGVAFNDPENPRDRLIALDTDIAQLEAAIQQIPDCRLAVIDPISGYMGSADDHKNAAVRGVLAKLSDLAARNRVAVLMLSHLRKGEDKHSANRVMGSMAYVAVSRMVWMTAWHTVDDGNGKPRKRRVCVICKGNLTPKRTGLEYEITCKHSSHKEPHIEWVAEPIDLNAADVLAQSEKTRQRGPEPKERNKAANYLRVALANGPRPVTELTEAAAGLGIKRHSLDRAKAELKVEAYRDAVPGPWLWILPFPQGSQVVPKAQALGNLGCLGETTAVNGDSDLVDCQGSQVVEPREIPGALGCDHDISETQGSQDCQDCQVEEGADVEDVNRLLEENAAGFD
jgi:putative DNA primase/helicase